MARKKQSTVKLFCYTCKEWFEYPAKGGLQAFKEAGHTNEKVKELDRDLGRRQR